MVEIIDYCGDDRKLKQVLIPITEDRHALCEVLRIGCECFFRWVKIPHLESWAFLVRDGPALKVGDFFTARAQKCTTIFGKRY